MRRVAVVADSGCDLSREQCERHGITVVPLILRVGGDTFEDGALSADEYWERVAAANEAPVTSQPSAGAFECAFQALVERGYDVLCTTVTSRHSGTINAAWTAAQRFVGRVRVYDTLSLSLGEGLQSVAAAEAASEGVDLDGIVGRLDHLRERIRVFIGLDTLEYLRNGGRASHLMPVVDRVAKMLHIKVLLNMVDGQLRLLGVMRSRRALLDRVRQEVLAQGAIETLCVVHTRLAEGAQALAEEMGQSLGLGTDKIWVSEAGPVLASHGGPRVMGVGVVRK